MCIVVDICDTLLLLLLLDIFFTFPPAGPQTKGLVKSLDFPTQFPLSIVRHTQALKFSTSAAAAAAAAAAAPGRLLPAAFVLDVPPLLLLIMMLIMLLLLDGKCISLQKR
jgi:hypothetical protein